ncbi:MAG TPA: GDSL-type esterase/lipase family protein [Nannocystis sp.]
MPSPRRLPLQARPWLVGVSMWLALGCGPGGCHAPQQGSLDSREPAATPVDSSAQGSGGSGRDAARTIVAAPPGPTPMLNDEARAARLFAQRVALGERAPLLEDPEGKPFPSLAPLASLDAQVQPAGFGAPVVASSNLDALPGSRGTGLDGAAAAPAVNGNLLGNFILLGGGGAESLQGFHEALRRLKQGADPDGKVRVLVYGASHTAADVYPGYLRAYLQSRFGAGGQGYVPLVRPSKFYRPTALTLESSRGWKVEHAQTREGRDDGYYGLMGASASSKPKKKKEYTRVIPAITTTAATGEAGAEVQTSYDVYYLRQPGGGRFKLRIDGKDIATISTKAKEVAPGYHVITRPGGPHTVEVLPQGDGEVRLFGMVVENDRPGVVVDTLGIGGTRAANQLKWNEHIWSDNLRRRAPDLVVLAYGTNESVDEDQPIETYRKQLREVLARIHRAAPSASCMLIGPGDFPFRAADGTFTPRPRDALIVAAQREVAAEAGCAFWDAMQFMGGELSMVTWAAAQPAMANSDHLHLSRRGYVRMGMALTDALMFDYDAATVAPPVADTGTQVARSVESAAPAPGPEDSSARTLDDPPAPEPASRP